MSEDAKRPPLKKLAQHLAALAEQAGSPIEVESDMISLIVSGTLSGEDIARRYPAFYRKLLESPELRQAFLDVLESVEAERSGQMVPLPESPQADLSFLVNQPSQPKVESFGQKNWRATWRRTLEELQAIFSLPRMVYRAEADPLDDPWFPLLREEISATGTTYAVVIECTISDDMDQALAAFLNLAVTVGSSVEPAQFPLQARLKWGAYEADLHIPEEGRFRFPDIPLHAVYDSVQQTVVAGLDLVLESSR